MSSRANAFRIAALLLLLGAVAVAGHWLAGQRSIGTPSLSGPLAALNLMRGRFVPQPQVQLELDKGSEDSWETFWTNRLTYPTGRFDASWYLKAEQQDARIARGVPAGRVIYSRVNNPSPLSLDPTRFTSLGPRPVNSFARNWSGRVNSIAFDPVITTTAYIAVNGGGVWKTTNCCTSDTTWSPLTDGPEIPIIGVDNVIVDPHDHNTVYAGTGDLNFTIPEIPSAGILKSTDRGTTWSVLGADTFAPPYPGQGSYPQDQAVGKIQVDPRDGQRIVAGTAKGVYFSYDAGRTWSGPCFTNSFSSTQREDTTGLLLRDNGTDTDLYVAVGTRAFSVTVHPVMAENGADGIYRTTLPDSGCPASWTLVSRPDNGWPAGTGSGVPHRQGGNPVGRIDLAFAPSTTGPGSTNVTIYAQAQSAATLGQLGLWRSTDGGDTWEERSDVNALGGCGFDWGQNWFDQFVTVDPVDPDTVYMGTFEVWKSTDGGATFTDLTCSYSGGIVHPDEHALAIAPGTRDVLLAGNDGGMYLSTDAGNNWVDLNSSLSTLETYAGDITAGFANSAQPGAAAGTQDNGSMANLWSGPLGPAEWTGVLGGDGFWSRVEPVQAQRWYAEVNGNGQRYIYMSSNGPYGPYSDISGNWHVPSSPIMPYELYKYDCPDTGCTHMIVGTNRVDESLTGMGDWVAVSPNFTGYIDQLSYSVSLSTTAIVGLSNGQVQYGFGLGQGHMATWVNVSGGNTVLPNRPVMDVTTDPLDPLVGYAAMAGFDENTPSTPGHVFKVTCTANCASFTWQNKSGNLPDIPIDSIIANPRYRQQVFAGSDWGLYYTNDITAASPVWERFDAGLPHVMVYEMTIDRGFTTLALWTRSRGAYAWPLPEGPWPPSGSPTPTFTAQPSATSTAIATATAIATRTPCTISFTDVHPTDYFYQPVLYLTCQGAISGYSDGSFRPFNNTTRGQLSKIVVLAVGWTIDTTGGPHFSDVPENNPFYAYIETAYNHGVISGYSDGTFRWGNNVTRAQLSKIVVSAMQWTIDTTGGPHFSDVPSSDPFYGYIETAYHHGIISGYADRTFRPGNNATRGQIAKIVYNAVTQP